MPAQTIITMQVSRTNNIYTQEISSLDLPFEDPIQSIPETAHLELFSSLSAPFDPSIIPPTSVPHDPSAGSRPTSRNSKRDSTQPDTRHAPPGQGFCHVSHRHYCPSRLMARYVFFDQKVARQFAHVHDGMKLARKPGDAVAAAGDLNDLRESREVRWREYQEKFQKLKEPTVGNERVGGIFAVMEV